MSDQRYVFLNLDELVSAFKKYGDSMNQLKGKLLKTEDVRDIFYDVAASLEKSYGDVAVTVKDHTGEEPS